MNVTVRPKTMLLTTPLPTSLPAVDAALHLAPERARVDAQHQRAPTS